MLLLVLLSGCGIVGQSDLGWPVLRWPGSPSSIEDIQSAARVDSTVQLRGRVGDRIPLINSQVYQLQDNTGTIWVLTNDPILQAGEQVSVRGRVRYQSIPLDGQEYGEAYIEEQKRWRDDS